MKILKHVLQIFVVFAVSLNGYAVEDKTLSNYVRFSAPDVGKWQDAGNDQHGSKIIVVPFDGAGLGSTISGSSVVSSAPVAPRGLKGGGADGIWKLLCLGLGTICFALSIRWLAPNH